MNKIFIIRNNQQYGPYDLSTFSKYIEEGKILMADSAFVDNSPQKIETVREIAKKFKVKTSIKQKGNLISQLKDIGRELIFPDELFSKKEFLKDTRLMILALLGLGPAFLIRFTFLSFLTFYTISLYFSVIWGLFFFYFFRTSQVKIKTTILLFFGLQVCVFLLWDILKLPTWPIINVLYAWTENNLLILKLLGFIFGVGLFEELVKALPLLFILRNAKQPLIPQTMVFYGLMGGIAFGVFEGVQYQLTVNTNLDYANAFFMNIARLTSLPFLHAVWSGIAGYFLSFSNLYPRYRVSLYFLALMLPATIHGIYDVLGWSILGLLMILLSVILLMNYLKKGINYQSKLSN